MLKEVVYRVTAAASIYYLLQIAFWLGIEALLCFVTVILIPVGVILGMIAVLSALASIYCLVYALSPKQASIMIETYYKTLEEGRKK